MAGPPGRRRRESRGPIPLNEILDSVLDRAGRRNQGDFEVVRTAWDDLCAHEGIEQTRAVKYDRGTLAVEVVSPPLCAELAQFRGPALLASLRERVGDRPHVRRLAFRLGAARRTDQKR